MTDSNNKEVPSEDTLLSGLSAGELENNNSNAETPDSNDKESSTTDTVEAPETTETNPEVKLNPPAPEAPSSTEDKSQVPANEGTKAAPVAPKPLEVNLSKEALEALRASGRNTTQEAPVKTPTLEEARDAIYKATGRPVVTKELAAEMLGTIDPSDAQVAKLQEMLDATATFGYRMANLQIDARLKDIEEKRLAPLMQSVEQSRQLENQRYMEEQVKSFYSTNPDLEKYPDIIEYVINTKQSEISELVKKGDVEGTKNFIANGARQTIKNFGIPERPGTANPSTPTESKSVPKPTRVQGGGRSQTVSKTSSTKDTGLLDGLGWQ